MINRTILVATLLCGLAMAGCGNDVRDKAASPAVVRTASAKAGAHCKHHTALAGASTRMDGNSLYQLAGAWTDSQGDARALADLKGRPVVISMIYTSCGYACPMIVHDMKKIAAALPEAQQKQVRFVLVSMDPARDTPGRLASFAANHHLDPAAWTLLRGDATDVRALGNLLGIRFRQERNGSFAHANRITLLDATGAIAYRQDGLGNDPSSFAAQVKRIAGKA